MARRTFPSGCTPLPVAGVRLRFFLLALTLAASLPALAARPPFTVPTDPSMLLERLPSGYAALMPTASPSTTAAGIAPPDPMAAVERLLAAAGSTGDARLAARADALLARMPTTSTSDRVLRARAFSAQHRHDFQSAKQILDMLIARSPRDGDARLSRAQIETLQGDLRPARSDCAVLALGVDSGRGLLCVATLAAREGQYAAAARVLDQWLAESPGMDPSRRYALVMRAEVASRARDGDADRLFRSALAMAPQDVRTLSAYARHLRARGRQGDVIALLTGAPNHDGLALQRALAAQALQLPSSAALTASQVRRYALARALGTTPELRDEAELHLTLQDDPQRAVVLAAENFRTQRDVEDVDILWRSATAARDVAALQRLRAWLAEHGLPAAELAATATPAILAPRPAASIPRDGASR